MHKIENYITGKWIQGEGAGQVLRNAVTGEPLCLATTAGIDFKAILEYGRTVGNPQVRKLSFQERGKMLKALALYLRNHLETFYSLSYQTGATRADSWTDIEGGIGNLFSYASLRRKFPDDFFYVEGEAVSLSKSGNFIGQHLLVPKEGVAIHINAYNFPVWGMLEKFAVNFLAGVPAIIKPATLTSFLTKAVVEKIQESGILPPGSLQLICGSAGDLLDHVCSQDIVTFTGSAATGLLLKSNPAILRENVPFTMEADSLNCIVLGEDITPSMPEWEIFIREIRKEMTSKAGQKCTAIRRIFVPEHLLEAVAAALSDALSRTIIGNPRNETVRMGSLAGLAQREEVRGRVQQLLASSRMIYGSLDSVELCDADATNGAFLGPVLLLNESPFRSTAVHEIEAFGPVATLMPYKNTEDAIQLSKKGKGSLCSTIVTAEDSLAKQYVLGAGTHHGRILVLNQACAKESTGHGSPLPLLVHGGPGRAGGGEEMGGIRGVRQYMQRIAVQGTPTTLTRITNIYQTGAAGQVTDIHPFKKYFEDLVIGEQLVTPKKLVTAALIDHFADLTGDHFYAHLRETDFTGTMFLGQVAHGYLLISLAAGLFVDSYEKNPVLLNYGIEELRFTKPVYPGIEIFVRLTCKEKISQDKREPEDLARGIVKWLVEIFDDTGELAGIGTILTMVKKREDAAG